MATIPAVSFAEIRGKARDAAGESRRALLACFLFGILLLSVPSSKRGLYLLPLAPALAATAGSWLARLDNPAERSPLCRPTALLILAGLAIVPLVFLSGAVLLKFFVPPLESIAGVDAPVPLKAALTPIRFTTVVTAMLATSGILAWAAVRHLRDGSIPRPALLIGPLCVFFLVSQVAIRSFLEPVKSLRPFTDAVARAFPGGTPVVSYLPAQDFLGIIHFNLGRPVRALRSEKDLRAFLTESPGEPFVFEMKKTRLLPEDIRARLRFIYDDTGTADSPSAIVVQELGVEN